LPPYHANTQREEMQRHVVCGDERNPAASMALTVQTLMMHQRVETVDRERTVITGVQSTADSDNMLATV